MELEKYDVYHPNWDIKLFTGIDAEDAAGTAAEYYDSSGGYTLAGGDESFFAVRRHNAAPHEEWEWYRSTARTSIDYYSDAVEEKKVDNYYLSRFTRYFTDLPEDADEE